MRLIDADKLYEEIKMGHLAYIGQDNGYNHITNISDVLDLIEYGAETIEAESVNHGYWIGKPISGYATVRCSNCKSVFLENRGTWKYCPDCSAKMDGSEE